MSNYNQIVSFGPKDSLATGNPAKRILGSEIDPELQAISAAISTKLDAASLANEVGQQAIAIQTASPAANTPGFRGLPASSQTASYTSVLTDMGGMVIHPSGAGSGDVYTIPANSSVAYQVGATLTFANLDTNTVSIAINSDTLVLRGTSLTGTRTLAANGMATAVKVANTMWFIGGDLT